MPRLPRRKYVLFALAAAAGLAVVAVEAYHLSPEVRVGAAGLLERAGADARLAGMLADQHGHVRRAAAEALVRRGPAAVPALVRQIEEPTDPGRLVAVSVLGQIGADARAALPALRRGAKDDPNPSTRLRFAEATYRVGRGDPAVLDDLLAALDHGTYAEQGTAAGALLPFGAPPDRAVPILIRLLADPNPAVRVGAADTLGEFGAAGRAAVPALVVALADPDRKVRREAAESLEAIAAGLGEADGPLRATAAAALAARPPEPAPAPLAD